jgi:uncharacterized protein (DUF58 family)
MTSQVEMTVRLKARYMPFLIGLLLLMQLIWPHKSWTVLLVLLGGAWLIGNRWARSLAEGLELKRERRFGWSQVGDRLQERFTLANRGWAPALWVSIRDHSTLPGYQASKIRQVGGWAVIHWFTQGQCRRRGVFTLGPTSVEVGDPFGFYQVTLEYPGLASMIVLPPVLALPAIDVAPAARTGDGRLMAERTPDRSVNADGVREYFRGDSPRRIHWPTSARRDGLFVLTFDSTPASDRWIFLDMYLPAQAGEGLGATEEHSVILAASLASGGLASGTPVGLAASGGVETVWLPPRLGADQRWHILRELALVKTGHTPLSRLLASAGATLKGRSSLVLITADVEGGWLDALVILTRRGIVPTVLVLDREAFGGKGKADRVLAELLELGINRYRITPDLLDRRELQPGQVGKWRRSPQGNWEPKFDPRALEWIELT